MIAYTLVLSFDGEIVILKDTGFSLQEQVYHRSFNPLEDLKENLMIAFKEWEKLSNEAMKEK